MVSTLSKAHFFNASTPFRNAAVFKAPNYERGGGRLIPGQVKFVSVELREMLVLLGFER
jgi:hypothetical protein